MKMKNDYNKKRSLNLKTTLNLSSKHKPGTKVYLSKKDVNTLLGPYLIEDVISTGKYTLCDEDGNQVEDGRTVADKDLRKDMN